MQQLTFNDYAVQVHSLAWPFKATLKLAPIHTTFVAQDVWKFTHSYQFCNFQPGSKDISNKRIASRTFAQVAAVQHCICSVRRNINKLRAGAPIGVGLALNGRSTGNRFLRNSAKGVCCVLCKVVNLAAIVKVPEVVLLLFHRGTGRQERFSSARVSPHIWRVSPSWITPRYVLVSSTACNGSILPDLRTLPTVILC